jgi:hypothetical protein
MNASSKNKTVKNTLQAFLKRIRNYFTRKNVKWDEPTIPSHSKNIFGEPIEKGDTMINFKLGTSWIYESQKGKYYKKKNYKRERYGAGSPRVKNLIPDKRTIRYYKASITPGLNRTAEKPFYFIDRIKFQKEIMELKKKQFVTLDFTKYQVALASKDSEAKAKAIQELAVLKRIIKDAYNSNAYELTQKYKNLEMVANIAWTMGIVNAVTSFGPMIFSLTSHAKEATSASLNSLHVLSKMKLKHDIVQHTVGLGTEKIAEITENMHRALELGAEKVIHDTAKELQEKGKVDSAKELLEEIKKTKMDYDSIDKMKDIIQKETIEGFENKEKEFLFGSPRFGKQKVKGILVKSVQTLFKITPLLLLIIAAITNPLGNVMLGIAIVTEITKLGAETAAEHFETKVETIELRADKLIEDIDHIIENDGVLFKREYNPVYEKNRKIKNTINMYLNKDNRKSKNNILRNFKNTYEEANAERILNLMLNDVERADHNKEFNLELDKYSKLEQYNNSNLNTLRKRNKKLKNIAREQKTRRNRPISTEETVLIKLPPLTTLANRNPSNANSLFTATPTEGNVPGSPAYSAPSASQPNNPNENLTNNNNQYHI